MLVQNVALEEVSVLLTLGSFGISASSCLLIQNQYFYSKMHVLVYPFLSTETFYMFSFLPCQMQIIAFLYYLLHDLSDITSFSGKNKLGLILGSGKLMLYCYPLHLRYDHSSNILLTFIFVFFSFRWSSVNNLGGRLHCLSLQERTQRLFILPIKKQIF